MKTILKLLFAVITSIVIVASCAKDPSQKKETMGAVTGAATHISCRNAEISGKANLPGTTSTDLSFGVLYSTSSGVLIGSATQIEARSFDSDYNYTVNTEVLEPETTYYYRSYIIQDKEISYGELKSFKTLAVSSMIQTLDVTEINPKDAVLNASLDLTDCKYDGLEYGFEVTPEGGSVHTVKSTNHSEKRFSAKDETLIRDLKYSVTAYVKIDGCTYKGEAKVFTTTSVQASVTAESSNVSYNSATISGKLTVKSEGAFSKSAVLYYSSTANTLEALKSSGTKKTLTLGADGSYSINLSSLVSDTQYNYVVITRVDDVEFVTDVCSFTTPDCTIDPDAPVLYNFAKEFVKVSREAWTKNVAGGKIKQHTEEGGLIMEEVHYIPDSWSDPEETGKWTTYTVAGKTYSVEEAYDIATRGFLMLMGYDVAKYQGGASATTLPELKPAATLSTDIPALIEGKTWKWGGLPYNESGFTEVGGAQTANGGPLRKGTLSAGTAAGTANVCELGLLVNYARRHFTYVYNNGITIANMCGYSSNQYAGYFGTCCAKRFYMALVSFYEYMLNNNLMHTSSISVSQLFDCTLYGNPKWD